jgi:hypothetical protein
MPRELPAAPCRVLAVRERDRVSRARIRTSGDSSRPNGQTFGAAHLFHCESPSVASLSGHMDSSVGLGKRSTLARLRLAARLANHRPHNLQGRLGARPEPDLAGRLMHEHAKATAHRRTMSLRLEQEGRARWVIYEIDHELARPEPARVDSGDKSLPPRVTAGPADPGRVLLGASLLHSATCPCRLGCSRLHEWTRRAAQMPDGRGS